MIPMNNIKSLSIIILFLLLVSACSPSATPVASGTLTVQSATPTGQQAEEFVKVAGTGFTLGGEPFRFIGANSIYYGFYQQYGYSIEEAIRDARENNLSVMRIYLGFGDTTWGSRPAVEYDRALDIASRNGMRIIAVLTDCCCFGSDWSSTREKYYGTVKFCDFSSSVSKEEYKKFIKRVLERENTVNGRIYKDDPTIMAWDILNEPAMQFTSDAEFKAWLAEISAYIKTIDPNHLLTIGLENGNSLYDQTGPHYDALNVPDLDFFSIHFNLPAHANLAAELPRLEYRVKTFTGMGKPVVLEEFGIGTLRGYSPQTGEEMTAWVNKYKDQMDILFSAGGSGALFWGWGVPETRGVPLWWRQEDHDQTEEEFVAMLREYKIPEQGSIVLPTAIPFSPDDAFSGQAVDESRWQILPVPEAVLLRMAG